MTLRLDTSRFPSLKESVRAHWAPILLEPISGSDERFVIGVAAANANGFHVELANCHEKITCFYGENAPTIVNAITLAGMCLLEDLAERSTEALFSPDPPVSGVTIGRCRESEGASCSIPEHCIDARRLPLFIARSVLRDLIAGLRAEAEGVQTA